MAHIIWCGNKKWDSEFPEKPLPENAVKMERDANIFTGSLIYGVVPFLICLLIIYIKWHWLGTKTVYPALVPVGILIGLILMPVHELLHAVCYSFFANQTLCELVYFYFQTLHLFIYQTLQLELRTLQLNLVAGYEKYPIPRIIKMQFI